MLSKYGVIFRIAAMAGMIAVGLAIHLPSVENSGPAAYLGAYVKDQSGKAIVSVVVPGSPANLAGVQPGDEIVSLNGRDVDSAARWDSVLKSLRVGENVAIVVGEGDRTYALVAQLTLQPERTGTSPLQPTISFYGPPSRY